MYKIQIITVNLTKKRSPFVSESDRINFIIKLLQNFIDCNVSTYRMQSMMTIADMIRQTKFNDMVNRTQNSTKN